MHSRQGDRGLTQHKNISCSIATVIGRLRPLVHSARGHSRQARNRQSQVTLVSPVGNLVSRPLQSAHHLIPVRRALSEISLSPIVKNMATDQLVGPSRPLRRGHRSSFLVTLESHSIVRSDPPYHNECSASCQRPLLLPVSEGKEE